MPDGSAPDFTYRRAVRGRFAPLLMLSGPSGSGKTFSALRLGTGMAGPEGKICFADTDRGRAKLYADRFAFDHLDLGEPFRPALFEAAAIAAQKQGADVLIIDNFSHEWSGLLEWHEQELDRMSKGDYARREALKMVGWGIVKPPHKHLLQTLYRLNIPVILCCAAENKIAMVEKVENGKKKTVPVDRGLQPIGDKDIAFAMTASLMLGDVTRPGTPQPVKALLPDLQPIIALDRALNEATGARLAAWARGEKRAEPAARAEAPSPPPPASAPPEPPADTPAGGTLFNDDEQRVKQGAKDLAAKFDAVRERAEHDKLVRDKEVQRQIEWLKKHLRPLWTETLEPAIKRSYDRAYREKTT